MYECVKQKWAETAEDISNMTLYWQWINSATFHWPDLRKNSLKEHDTKVMDMVYPKGVLNCAML
jgi:hypothetical protein